MKQNILIQSETSAQNLSLLIEEIRKFLPIQNPLYKFVHNNPLQFFESHHFFEGCIKAAWHYQTVPFKSIREYQDAFASDNPEFYLRQAHTKLKKDHLVTLDFETIHAIDFVVPLDNRLQLLPTQFWQHHDRPNYERQIHDFILPFVSSYMDQGVASWHFPHSQKPMRKAFEDWLADFPSWSPSWVMNLKKMASDIQDLCDEEAILKLLPKWQIETDMIQDVILDLLFNLKGWSGMINRFESDELCILVKSVPANLTDWILILLLTHVAMNHQLENETGQRYKAPSLNQLETSKHNFRISFEPLIVWHTAYENFLSDQQFKHHFQAIEKNYTPSNLPTQKTKYQAIFCIDDREEGLRRHLENANIDIETFAAVGFFGVDMLFHGYDIALPTAQCPPVITPKHVVKEVAIGSEIDHQEKSELSLSIVSKIRNFAGSLMLSLLSSLPLSLRILSPGTTEMLRNRVQKSLFPKPPTKLILDGKDGFTVQEQATIVWEILAGCGIENNFAEKVFIISHGSTSTNNPFRQAYGCGACGGNSGKPNSLAFCMMANNAEVRHVIKATKNMSIPDSSTFIPMHHDTTTDRIELLDQSLRDEAVHDFLNKISKAGELNALERSLDFASYSGPHTIKSVIAHVHDRAYDLSQPRPEYGHNKVAMCFIGKRETVKKINLKRRSFLVSYDHEKDPDGSHLKNIILGAVPVCANISLDYFFSAIAEDGLGAGTKLPLNINGLIGVMTGSKGDLRIGLAKQMTEIHETTRIHVVIACAPELLTSIVNSHGRLKQIVNHRWIHLYCLNPTTGKISYYESH